MTKFDYDLFVVGAGSGGVRAARIAAQYGAKVAIAEEYRVGGTCVIRGCVPKKLLVYAAHYAEAFEDARGFGWTTGSVAFNWQKLIANKDREIDRLNNLYIRGLESAGAELIMARATLIGPNEVALTDGGKATARIILVATGARPFVPNTMLGHDLILTSNEIFHLPNLPRRICIVGGGYIAVEFAGIFSALGVDTVLLVRGGQILRGFDEDLAQSLTVEMKKKSVDIWTDAVVEKIERSGDGVRITLKDGRIFGAGQIFYATGRIPNSAGLGLEEIGVRCDHQSQAIIVDDYSRSSVASIYAVGDVTNRINLTPVAIHEGQAFADMVFGGKDVKPDHRLVPTAVFSQPEIGTVGLSEAQARQNYADIVIHKTSFRPMKHALSGREERIMMKLIVEKESDKILGCHMCGEGAAEMIQLLGVALKMGAKKSDFDATMAVHPTMAEEFVTMR